MTKPTSSQTTGPQDSHRPPSFKVYYILGPPGSGKGTLCAKTKHAIQFEHLSVGDYLRGLCDASADTESLDAAGMSQDQLRLLLQARTLVPPAPIVVILQHALSQLREAGYRGVLLDGFPRDLAAATLFEAQAPDFAPTLVLNLECRRSLAEARFLQRKRSTDDTAQIFDQRYNEFITNHAALTSRYKEIIHNIPTDETLDVASEDMLATLLKFQPPVNV